jgi:DNA repair exonuclease SbcCD ATPase subunit
MRKRLLSVASGCVSAALLCASLPAFAQSDSLEDRLRAQLRSTVEQLRQLQDTQAQLQSDKATAEQQRDKALADLKAAQGELDAAKGKSGAQEQAERSLASERASHAKDSQELVKVKAAYDALLAESRTQEAQCKQAQGELKTRDTQLQTCEAKNVQLYKVGHDILDAYEHVDLGTFMKTRQPFAQSARVKYDEIAQQYGDQLYAGKYDPNAVAARPAAASGASGTSAAASAAPASAAQTPAAAAK